jgi:hypothetical protein
VEHGLFLGMAQAAVVASGEHAQVLRPGVAAVDADGFAELP